MFAWLCVIFVVIVLFWDYFLCNAAITSNINILFDNIRVIQFLIE